MDIQDILEEQRDILLKIKETVSDEKQVLMKNDAKALSKILEKKTDYLEKLDEIKKAYISNYGQIKISDMTIPEHQLPQIEKLMLDIRQTHKEIQDYQHINLMLTHQSINYQNTMMFIIQQAIKKSGSVYGENGKIESNEKIKTSIDQSV